MSKEESLREDRATLEAIGSIYCRAHCGAAARGEAGLCEKCVQVVDYAMARTEKCPNNHEGNCQDCPIHCYNGDMRAAVKAMMKYSAPRMIYKHPIMTIGYARKKLKAKQSK